MSEFYEDPYFKGAQEELFPFYSNILKGDIPEYYAPIGEWGGAELEDLLTSVRGDIGRGVTEDLARRKVRGARGAGIISKAMGGITPKLRWEDYMRGLKGRETLLGVGTRGLEGVRGAGLEYGRQKTAFGLETARMEEVKKAEKDKMWSDILESVIGGIGTIGGAYFGGPAGAAIGGRLGSAAGGMMAGGEKYGSYGSLDIGGDIWKDFGNF